MPKLTDSPYKKDLKSPRSRSVVATTNRHWSDKQKLDAVNTYLMMGGSVKMVSELTKIPEDTIYIWKRTDWWNNLVNEIRKEERLTLSTKLKNVMEASWTVVADRLERGDWIYDQKTGELRRKPVSLRDAGRIALDAANLRTKMDIEENHTIANEQIEEKLNKLAKAFANLSRGIVETPPPEDIEYVEEIDDAVHEEREEGLQEGVRELPLETGTESQPQ